MRKSAYLLMVFLLVPVSASAFDFTVHGYYRNRTKFYHDLDTQTPNSSVRQEGLGDKPCRPNAALTDQAGDNDCFGSILFNQQRLRLEPIFKLNDNISVHTQMDVLDNLIYGTESTKQLDFVSPIVGTVQLPGAGGALGMVGSSAGENKAINIRRAWVNILTPGGLFRIGRQPSQWGLGIFQNDGNQLEDDFGDSFDRILYMAALDTERLGTYSFGAAMDITYSNQSDPRIAGLGDAIQGFDRDMRQFEGIFMYENEFDGLKLTLGTVGGIRYRNGVEGATTTTARSIVDADNDGVPDLDAKGNSQLTDPIAAGNDGNTLIHFFDFYSKAEFATHYTLQAEYIYVGGDFSTGLAIDAVPFNGLPSNALGPYEMPAQSQLQTHMAAFEGTADYDWGEFKLQSGYATGDADPLSSTITQFGFRPDYKIANLLFHVPLGRSPSITQENGTGGSRVLVGGVPVTGNFVNNAVYVGLGYKHKLDISSLVPQSRDVKAGLKLVTAWTDQSNFNIDFQEITGIDGLPKFHSGANWYGLEVDTSLEGRFFDYLVARIDGSVLFPGSVYDVHVDPIDPGNLAGINTIVEDQADIAAGVMGSIAVEF